MAGRLVGGAQIGGSKQPAAPDHRELDPGIRRSRARFVPDDMRLVADHDLVTGAGQDLEADLVGHRAARHKQSRLLAQQFGDPLLQAVDRRVLAILVVADRRRSHRLAHARRWSGNGIRAEIDAVHGEPDYGCARDRLGREIE